MRRVLALLLLLPLAGCAAAPRRTLRVCADPNNLPFSNEKKEGFENRIAEVLADELHARVSYTWWAQRRGFVRNTLNAGQCDLIAGVPSSFELAQTTRSYYRSTYVFVSRSQRAFNIHSFDDARLRQLKIGVPIIGDDYANSPPAHALARRGIISNVRGFMVYGDYREADPPAGILAAVERGEVDIAVVWGPLAGYFAKDKYPDLTLQPVSPAIDPPFLPFVFDISMAVRRADPSLRAEIDAALEKRAPEIERILDDYGVPRFVRGQGWKIPS